MVTCATRNGSLMIVFSPLPALPIMIHQPNMQTCYRLRNTLGLRIIEVAPILSAHYSYIDEYFHFFNLPTDIILIVIHTLQPCSYLCESAIAFTAQPQMCLTVSSPNKSNLQLPSV